MEEFNTIVDGRAARGLQALASEEVFGRAVAMAFREKQQELAGNKIASKVEKRRRQGTARPHGRAAPEEPDGEAKARRTVARKLKELGADQDEEVEEGDFLG